MSLQDRRTEILDHLREIRTQFLGALDGLSDEQMSDPSIDGWSVKDHLVHLAFWHDLRASEIVRITAGYEHAWPPTVDSQALNDIVQPARANLGAEQALWEYESALERVEAAVTVANERGLAPDRYGEVGPDTTHDVEHAGFIRKWRERRGI